jgi:hypothetical protein
MRTRFQTAILTVSFFILAVGCNNLVAQPGPPGGWANMDPQQMQEQIQKRMLESLREQLVVTNDAEWKVIEQRLSKVSQLRMESMFSGLGMMNAMRMFGGRGGGFRGFPGFGQPDRETESLQRAVDNNAPLVQLKDAIERFREARRRKEAEMSKAQQELREVLTVRQEAILVLAGMLD